MTGAMAMGKNELVVVIRVDDRAMRQRQIEGLALPTRLRHVASLAHIADPASRIFTSWNQAVAWLRRLEALRLAA